MNFNLSEQSRKSALDSLLPKLEAYYSNTKGNRLSSDWNIEEVKKYSRKIDIGKANDLNKVLDHVLQGLTNFAVHTPHPNYFGLFNPRANFPSILADLMTATFNPQLAAWSHAPFANEIESFVIQEFGKKMGYPTGSIDGTFCTGGAESNLTAIVCALNRVFPDFKELGIQGIKKTPVLYCSSESHHSIVKAAKITGLGSKAVRSIGVNQDLKIDTAALKLKIKADRENGFEPFMIVGTGGTTGAGAIDDLETLRAIADEASLWLHVDAAYGGASVISQKYKSALSGIGLSDSITLDLHKWFSIPMSSSLFLTSDKTILHESFAVKTNYMPEDGDPNQIIDPYVHSVQWSRRFIGLKIYLPLAVFGWGGYEEVINQQIETGIRLKTMLLEKGWEVLNNTPFPIICFSRKEFQSNEMTTLVNKINTSGKAWLSVYPIHGKATARVCITNYMTDQSALNELIDLLELGRMHQD